MAEFFTIFLALIFETTPFLLAGVAIAAVGGPWLERSLSSAAMRTPGVGAMAGSGAGIFLPMCDCGSRPLAHRLALAGKREFAMAFMVAAPVINPIVLVTTWLAFRDAELLALRFGLTLSIALATAFVLVRLRGELALPGTGGHGHDDHGGSGWSEMPGNILREFFELFQFLVLGSAMAAAIQVFVDQSLLTEAQGIFLSVAAMMALAFLLSICSSVDAFVVSGLAGALGTGPILAFLVFGPVVNLKSMPLYLRLFSVPTVIILVVIATQVAFVSSVAVQLRAW
ncbi:MAG: permease [Dehalococcoidia bacterium]|nr:permease [Dehalococcoidia bacterium]